MPLGNVGRLAAALEKNSPSRNQGDLATSLHSRSTLGKKIRNGEVFSKTVMSMPDRVRRPRATNSSQSCTTTSHKNTDLTFLEKRKRPKEPGTVTTSQSFTTTGSACNMHFKSREKGGDDSENHGSFGSFGSFDFSNFDEESFESSVFSDDNGSCFASVTSGEGSVAQKQQTADGKANGIAPISTNEKDRAKSHQKRKKGTPKEKIKRVRKDTEMKRIHHDAAREKRKEKNDQGRPKGDFPNDESERSNVRSRKDASNHPNPAKSTPLIAAHYEVGSNKRSPKGKARHSDNDNEADKTETPTVGEQRLGSVSKVRKLASLIDSNHSSRSGKRSVKALSDWDGDGDYTGLSVIGSDRSGRRSSVTASNGKIENGILVKQPNGNIKDHRLPALSNIDSGLSRRNKEDRSRVGHHLEPEKGPTSSFKKISNPNSDSSVSSVSRIKGHTISGNERITRNLVKDDRNRTGDTIKRRERSISRERQKEKSLDLNFGRQILQTESACSTQPTSLLDSASDFNFALEEGDDDMLPFSTHTLPTHPLSAVNRKAAHGSQKVAQASVPSKNKEEHGKHKSYRSKFRDQYGATGVVETESLAPVKAAKSIFEKNHGENDLMRICKKRSTRSKQSHVRHSLKLPHQSRPHNTHEDELSVSLASLVGNVVLSDSSRSFSRQRLDEKSLSSLCSSQSRDNAAPSNTLHDHNQSLQRTHEKKLGIRKTKNDKSLEFLEKLSLKKVREDSRRFRGSRIRRTKRIDDNNVDAETFCENEDETVKREEDGDETNV